MKTKEELSELKEEVEILSRKLRELNEDELKQVSGGDIEITCELILQYIDSGNDRMAAGYFKLAQYRLAPSELALIRMEFLRKFGYPIDMFVE